MILCSSAFPTWYPGLIAHGIYWSNIRRVSLLTRTRSSLRLESLKPIVTLFCQAMTSPCTTPEFGDTLFEDILWRTSTDVEALDSLFLEGVNPGPSTDFGVDNEVRAAIQSTATTLIVASPSRAGSQDRHRLIPKTTRTLIQRSSSWHTSRPNLWILSLSMDPHATLHRLARMLNHSRIQVDGNSPQFYRRKHLVSMMRCSMSQTLTDDRPLA